MTALDLARANLLSPVVLCFVLGALSVAVRSDLKLPEAAFNAISIYLMLSIGLRGGAELASEPFAEFALPALGALGLGLAIPLWTYAILRRLGGFGVADAAALAAHYGSVSAVTFAAGQAMLERAGTPYEGYAAALLAIMEVPAIVVGLALAKVGRGGGAAGSGSALAGVLSGKSVLLLAGGLVIGALGGAGGLAKVKPFFTDLFSGVLCLFLLELGRVAGGRVRDFAKVGPFLAAFALLAPPVHGALGLGVAWATGMTPGGAVLMAALAASASYIAAPAAVRLALPEANPGFYLTASLALTFPFNIILGLPLYGALASALYG